MEKSICLGLQKKGFHVAGIDCAVYAQSDYTLDILQSDYAKIASMVRKRIKDPQPPLIIGGYSMGAAQAIAAAGGPHPPSKLVGLLVVDPLSRGRYGLRDADRLDVLPQGPGTFGADSFAGSMGSLRVVQWHAQDDDIDSHSWLDRLTAPYQFNTFDGTGHLYRVNREEFVHKLVHCVPWILENNANSERTATAATSR